MNYYEYHFTLSPALDGAADVLSALLCEAGFETFDSPSPDSLTAWIEEREADEERVQSACDTLHTMMGVTCNYQRTMAEQQDWNETWERESFHPIVVGDDICIHAPSQDCPKARYDIVIDPRMAFGTGSHATTRMLLGLLLDEDLDGKRIVDAGCGTGVLGILCLLRGATELLAYDIDNWSVENTIANLATNHLQAEVLEGDASVLAGREGYDLVLANINRNILLTEVPRMLPALRDGGHLMVSGFYTDDAACLITAFAPLGLRPVRQEENDGWCAIIFRLTLG